MKKTSNSFIAIGLMLFALFFGSGNLIFPTFLGQNAGTNVIPATIGFLITGCGLPLLAVVAVCYSGLDLQGIAAKIHPLYSIFFVMVLSLTIGPFFVIPRNCTVSFEMAVVPFLSEGTRQIALYSYALAFFIVSWWLSITPSKLVERVGKILTPLMLILLIALIVSSIIHPMGALQAPTAKYAEPVQAFASGFLEGYNTMDVIAGLCFGILVVQSVKNYGAETQEEVAWSAFRSGVVAMAFMALIYIFTCVIGAASVTELGMQKNGAPILVGATNYYFGAIGPVLLAVIVFLACLTTSIGLTAATAAYFHQIFPQISARAYATGFSIFSFGVALFGLNALISAAIPVLVFIYPLSISLIALTFLHKFFNDSRIVYVGTTLCMMIPSIYDGLHTAKFSFGWIDGFMASLLLADYGLSWMIFFFIGFIGSLIISKAVEGKGSVEKTSSDL